MVKRGVRLGAKCVQLYHAKGLSVLLFVLCINYSVFSETVKFYSVTINKAYKEGEEWKHTNSFNIEDLPKVALVATEAYKYIRLRENDSQQS